MEARGGEGKEAGLWSRKGSGGGGMQYDVKNKPACSGF